MARGGGRRGVQADSVRLVSRRGEVSGGVADADERADGGGAFRRGTRGDDDDVVPHLNLEKLSCADKKGSKRGRVEKGSVLDIDT